MNYYIPPELISEIVHHLLDDAPSRQTQDQHGKNTKPSWDLIESFNLVCREFRLISLARWFRALYLESPEDLKNIDEHFPMLKKAWCRRLHCVQTESSELFLWDLSGFEHVSYLRVDWVVIDNSPFHDCGVDFPFINVQPIEELDIRGLWDPSPMTLDSLVKPFTNLKILKLDFPWIWCSLCNTSNPVRFPSPTPGGSPTGFIYEGGLGLPFHYARALHSLEKLEEVFIRLPDIGPRLPSPGLSATSNENMWMGECDRCMAFMYDNEEFLRKWLSRKNGTLPITNPDKWSVYPHPPRLTKVHWNFWKLESTMNDMPYSLANLVSLEIASDESLTESDSDSESEEDAGETQI